MAAFVLEYMVQDPTLTPSWLLLVTSPEKTTSRYFLISCGR